MGTRLKNILHFVVPSFEDAPDGVTIAHELNVNGMPVVPDILISTLSAVDIVATDIDVTLINQNAFEVEADVLCEYWHSIERAFGDPDTLVLDPQPFIVKDAECCELPLQPFRTKDIVIYVNATGNDMTGTGSAAKPFRTYARAVRNIPEFIPSGTRYFINITNLGTEVLPARYTLPAWKGGNILGDPSVPAVAGIVLFPGAVNTFADLKLAGTTARARITNAQILAINTNPETELTEIVLTPAAAAAKAWVVDEWKGRFMWTGDPFDSAPIFGNTADTLFVASLFGAAGGPLDITEPSAVLTGDNNDGALGVNITDSANHFSGIAVRNTTPGDPGLVGIPTNETHLADGPTIKTNLCEIDVAQSIYDFWGWGTILRDSNLVDSPFRAFSCYFARNNFFGTPITQIVGAFVEEQELLAGDVFARLTALLVRDSPAHGVNHNNGGFLVATSVKVDDSVDDGINTIDGMGYVTLENVHGTGNGGVGLRVSNGAQVGVFAPDVDVDITGAGGDLEVGTLGVLTWANVAASDRYDITAVAAGGATGTGARVFTKV